MSFDVFLQGFADGSAGPVEGDGARRAFAELGLERRDEFGFFPLEARDGGRAEISGDPSEPDFDGCAFLVRRLTPDVAAAIWRVAEAGSMVVCAAMEPFRVMLTDARQRAHLPRELADGAEVVLITSPADVLEQLQRGYGTWAAYRDQIAQR